MQIVFDFRAELQKTQIVCFNSIKKIFLKPTKKNVIYFLSPFNNKEMTIANYNITIEITIKWKYDSKNSEELLAVVIDIVVTFVNHVENLYQKANQKLHALARVVNFMTEEKHRSVMKAFSFIPNAIIAHLYRCFKNNWKKYLRLQQKGYTQSIQWQMLEFLSATPLHIYKYIYIYR